MKTNRLLILFIGLIFSITAILPLAIHAQEADDFKPTPAPKIPAADFTPDGKKYLDLSFMRMNGDGFEMKGGGLGFNFVSMIQMVGWNIGIGAFGLTGENDDGTIKMNAVSVPFSANLAFRPYGTEDSTNAIIFAGYHRSWTGVWIDMEDQTNGSTSESDLRLTTQGPMGGIKVTLKISDTIKIIPYYVLKRESYDAEYTSNGLTTDMSIPTETYHLFGFDIELGSYSLGAMFDMITNSDSKMIWLFLTFNLDYDDEQKPETKIKKKRR